MRAGRRGARRGSHFRSISTSPAPPCTSGSRTTMSPPSRYMALTVPPDGHHFTASPAPLSKLPGDQPPYKVIVNGVHTGMHLPRAHGTSSDHRRLAGVKRLSSRQFRSTP